MGQMSKKPLQVIFYLLIGAIFVFTALGCPAETETPAPAGEDPAPTTENGDQPPQAGEPVSTISGPLVETMVNFFGALAEADFDKVRDYCTENFWENEFKDFEEMYETFSEEERAEMMAEFVIDEEKQSDLDNAVSEITGDTGTLTITEEDGAETVFSFVKEDGNWKIDSTK